MNIIIEFIDDLLTTGLMIFCIVYIGLITLIYLFGEGEKDKDGKNIKFSRQIALDLLDRSVRFTEYLAPIVVVIKWILF